MHARKHSLRLKFVDIWTNGFCHQADKYQFPNDRQSLEN